MTMLTIAIATWIGFTLGFIAGCIWATGRTLDKVQDWKCRDAIRKGEF